MSPSGRDAEASTHCWVRQDRVAGGIGELLDAGGDVADQGELELAAAANGSSDHHTGIDADPDPRLATESLGDKVVNQKGGGHSGISMIRKIVGGANVRPRDCQSAYPACARSCLFPSYCNVFGARWAWLSPD
jgi:hypothetical protein